MLRIAIIAGGLGTRLGHITARIPKALVPINGEPFIAHQLRLLRSHGITEAVLCTGYRGHMIEAYVGTGAAFGMQVAYSNDGDKALGTAGAVKKALPLLGEQFLVTWGDAYLSCPYADVEKAFLQRRCDGLMTVFRNDGKWDSSNVVFANGNVVRYDKKNRTTNMRYIDFGMLAFQRRAFVDIPEGSFCLSELCSRLAAQGRLGGYEVFDRFYETGSFQGIQDLCEHLRNSARPQSLSA